MIPGESILIEQTANGGFLVCPKEIVGPLDTRKHMQVFSTLEELQEWQWSHFGADKKALKAVK